MEKKTYHTSIIFGLTIILFGVLLAVLPWKQKNKNPVIDITGKFEAENFIRAVDLKGESFAKCDGKMLGAVVPHHMVGGKFIADFFSQVHDIDTVVVVGPNHFEKGDSPIITADSDWKTAKGTVFLQNDFVDGLLSKKIASAQNETIKADHSIGNILPFISYYLPGAKVVPIILKKNVPEEKFENLLQYIINQQKNGRLIIVGSIDFSHYLSAQDSEKKDTQTIKAIEEKNYGLINSFHDDNLDSPATLKLVLRDVNAMASNKLIWQNSNSFKVLGGDINNVTSYFELVFCKNEQ